MIAAVENWETKEMLDTDEELLANMTLPFERDSNSSSSQMIIPSVQPFVDDTNLMYDREKKDWIHVTTSSGDTDNTVLPDINDSDEEEIDMEAFLATLNDTTGTSTQKQCELCCLHYINEESHICEECPCCQNLVCTCGYPPEHCYLCKKVIGFGCMCPFESQ